MREKSFTTPRRKGPKHPLPKMEYKTAIRSSESPYYTIDNTEDIYGTNLSHRQRCYIDPWDLENYDYVHSKIRNNTTPLEDTYCDKESVEGSPLLETYMYDPRKPINQTYQLAEEPKYVAQVFAATLPRTSKNISKYECNLECCNPTYGRYRQNYELNKKATKYDDYMSYMSKGLQDENYLTEQNIYNSHGGISSSSSNERHSSVGEDTNIACHPYKQAPYSSRNTKSSDFTRPAPFIAPLHITPPLSPSYEYANSYKTLSPPFCSKSECYECLINSQRRSNHVMGPDYNNFHHTSEGRFYTLNHSASYKNSSNMLERAQSASSATPPSSLFFGIYSNKFGLSKKGLLQIDYSCSWNDLDRIIGRN